MKHSYKLLSIIFLMPLLSAAQSNYKAGLVVNSKGDTVRGFIDYREWENNPSNVDFKPGLNQAAKKYTPADIKYFQINQFEAFTSYSGKITTDRTDISHLPGGRDTGFRMDNVFLKVEQAGMYLTLYSYTDELKKRYFIAENSGTPSELIYRIYMTPDLGNNSKEENKYKGQLIYLSSKYNTDNSDLRSLINEARYNQDLVTIVEKINHTTRQKVKSANSPIAFFVGLSAGPVYVTPQPQNFDPHTSPNKAYGPKVSAGINIYTNPDVRKLVFRVEVSYASYNFKTYYDQFDYPAPKSYLTLNQKIYTATPQIIYNIYNSRALKFYVDAGVSYSSVTNSNALLYNSNGTVSGKNVFLNSWASIPLTVGVVINENLGIFVTYTTPTTISDLGSKQYSTQAGINYIFGRRK